MTEQFYLTVWAPELRIRIVLLTATIATHDFGDFERSEYENDFRDRDLSGMHQCTRAMIGLLFGRVRAIKGFHLDPHSVGIELNDDVLWTPAIEQEVIDTILEAQGLYHTDMVRVPFVDYQVLAPYYHLPEAPLTA